MDTRGDFLPNLCNVYGVFGLVLVGELLSLALVLADGGLRQFQWQRLGLMSLLVVWIILVSAALLCQLRPWFKRQSPVVAGCVSYALVLLVTLASSLAGQLVEHPTAQLDGLQVLTNMLVAALFAGVVLRYVYLQQQLQNQQQAELRARVQALQSRIRPHFLFNSMNSIASLIATQPTVAERMVEDLAGLFRASLRDPGLITLDRELELCRRFVRIEQLRLGERLHVRWHMPDAIPDDVRLPSLSLQPLIENAIYHGIQPLTEGGEVAITVELDSKQCFITVTNPVALEGSPESGHGLALDNIRHRLAAHFNARGQLLIHQENQHFVTTIVVPRANL